MNRIIKFRAWDRTSNKNGVMVSWDELKTVSAEIIFITNTIISPEITLMQFTGFYDKNEKEIYESDIVLVPFGYNGDYSCDSHISVVEYDEGFYVDKPEDVSWEYLEVIGNIYEHHHLLENKIDSEKLVKFGFSNGEYWHKSCKNCKKEFIGDKRATVCYDCAKKLYDEYGDGLNYTI